MAQEIRPYMIEEIYVEFMELYREYLVLRDFDVFYDRSEEIPIDELLMAQTSMYRRLNDRFSQIRNRFLPLLRGA